MCPQGITFGIGVQSDLYQFVNRCVEDIEKAPDSMQAGMSAVLMSHVSQCSEQMQRVVAEHVFLRLMDQLLSDSIETSKRVAFTSVLTSLLENAGTCFRSLTTSDSMIAAKLQQIVFNHLEINEDESMHLSWQNKEPIKLVLYEKTLYLA